MSWNDPSNRFLVEQVYSTLIESPHTPTQRAIYSFDSLRSGNRAGQCGQNALDQAIIQPMGFEATSIYGAVEFDLQF